MVPPLYYWLFLHLLLVSHVSLTPFSFLPLYPFLLTYTLPSFTLSLPHSPTVPSFCPPCSPVPLLACSLYFLIPVSTCISFLISCIPFTLVYILPPYTPHPLLPPPPFPPFIPLSPFLFPPLRLLLPLLHHVEGWKGRVLGARASEGPVTRYHDPVMSCPHRPCRREH